MTTDGWIFQPHDPAALKPGESWTRTCNWIIGPGVLCGTVTQGGDLGLASHQRVVHNAGGEP